MNSDLVLYFLRSSENKIVKDMTQYIHRNEAENKNIYYEFYGLTNKDLGLYALKDAQIRGAIWTRKLNKEHNSLAYIDEETPVLSLCVLPEFTNQGVATAMMNQFLIEAGAIYTQISVLVQRSEVEISFYKKFEFKEVKEHPTTLDNPNLLVMSKKLELTEILRPTDGYDPKRWMD